MIKIFKTHWEYVDGKYTEFKAEDKVNEFLVDIIPDKMHFSVCNIGDYVVEAVMVEYE